ncbi:MAG TPA: PIN domain-containing protein [Anaerolineae bacterium]|nr:PIN domain-containing protein [Anaerolineae bacterium]
MIFVDTSAFLAVLNADDQNHADARRVWENLVTREDVLVSSNYVLVETFAVVQNRLGMAAVKLFQDDILPVVTVEWVDETLHQAGIAALLTANRRQLSLVDCISFEMMRRLGIKTAFTHDRDFAEQGFECIP